MRPFSRATALVTAFAFTTATALPALADDAKIEEAKKHMEAGAAFYNDPGGHKCEEAYREFKKAYELSGSLNALKGMGVCALELERDGEAIQAYQKYLEGKGDQLDPAEKQQMDTDLTALKAAVATVRVSTDRPNVRIVDVRTPSRGFPITNRYAGSISGQALGIHPGSHTFTASADGEPDQVWHVEVANGGKYNHIFEFDKGKPVVAEGFNQQDLNGGGVEQKDHANGEGTRPVPTSVFIAGGLTVALAVPTAIFMVMASGKKSDYDAANGHKPKAELEDMRSSVTSANLVADVFLGATAVGLVTTGVLYFTRPTKKPAPAAATWTVAPSVATTGGGAFVTGTF
jgi:hypothetical protein